MKNGVIISTAIREDEAKQCIENILRYTPSPRAVLLMHAPGSPEIDAEWPEQVAKQYGILFKKMEPGQSGGLTAAWNEGFRILMDEHHCTSIICMNDDVFVTPGWHNIFQTIKDNPLAMVGPVSNNPGVDYTGCQKATEAKNEKVLINARRRSGSKQKEYYCVNGFCFGLSSSLCRMLINKYGSILDSKNFPWGGQEEDLGFKIEKLGGPLIVDKNSFVHHIKYSDWRRLGFLNK